MEGEVKTIRRIVVILITFLLLTNVFIITDFCNHNKNVSANGFPRDIFIEIHRIMELDEIDDGSEADWYFHVGVDEGMGYYWKHSPEPVPNSKNHMILDAAFNFTVSSSPVSVAIYLCEDDLFNDDLADISPYPGDGVDDFPVRQRGATCEVSYNLTTHSWTGDVNGSVSTGYCETNGEWDGSAGPDTNDAALWFMIWDDTRVDITYPVFAVPLIQPKSDTFEIDVYLEGVYPPTSWNATIFTGYDSFDLQINNITQNDAYNWTLTIQAPVAARFDLYDLKVEVDGVWDTEPHSISLIDSFSSDFKFIHITDLHIDDPAVEYQAGVPGDENHLNETNITRNVIQEINLIYPDFVIVSGDIGDNPEGIGQNEVRQYEVAREVLLELQIPAFIVSGNHDWRDDVDEEADISVKTYWEYINRYANFWWDYGNSRFVGLDSGWDDVVPIQGTGLWQYQIDYLNALLPGHSPNFIVMHHTGIDPDGPPGYFESDIAYLQTEFRNLCEANNVEIVHSGHTHIDEVWDRFGSKQTGSNIESPTSPLYLQTKSATHNDTYNEHGYRLIRVSGGSVTNYTYDRDGNGQRDANSSIVSGMHNLTFSPSNNGTANTVTATVENNLYESFQDARIVFKMPKPQPGKQYHATNGWIEQKIECPTFDVYYVRTNISNESTKDVILQQGYSLALEEGWNLISIPFIQPDTNVDSVLSSINGSYDAAQWYNISDTSDSWKHKHISKPSNLNDFIDINHTMGFWIHITEPGGVLYAYPGTQPTSNQTITLHPGWNMVGYPSLSNLNRTMGLNNLEFGLDVDAILWYDAATKTWHFMDQDDPFVPGRGYWVHSTVEIGWEVPI